VTADPAVAEGKEPMATFTLYSPPAVVRVVLICRVSSGMSPPK